MVVFTRNTIAATAFSLLIASNVALAQTGSITGSSGTVNGSPGTNFQPGDYIVGSSFGSLSNPATGPIFADFRLLVEFYDAGVLIADSAAVESVERAHVGAIADYVGYHVSTVLPPNYINYEPKLYIMNTTTMMWDLIDSDFLVFSSD